MYVKHDYIVRRISAEDKSIIEHLADLGQSCIGLLFYDYFIELVFAHHN